MLDHFPVLDQVEAAFVVLVFPSVVNRSVKLDYDPGIRQEEIGNVKALWSFNNGLVASYLANYRLERERSLKNKAYAVLCQQVTQAFFRWCGPA